MLPLPISIVWQASGFQEYIGSAVKCGTTLTVEMYCIPGVGWAIVASKSGGVFLGEQYHNGDPPFTVGPFQCPDGSGGTFAITIQC
jgi:hypothetical protein